MTCSRRTPRSGPTAFPLLPAALLAVLLAGCAGRRPPAPPSPPPPAPDDVRPGWSQTGLASWYGPGFDGRPTASGEIFDMEAMTAAHRHLPFGTRVEVTVLETGRRTRLRINDRGPFVADRVLDASRAAARRLGFLRDGTARVRIVVMEVPARCWEVQVGAFGDRRNVEEAREKIRRAGEPARTERTPDGLTRVLAGPYGTERRARAARERVGGFVRACPTAASVSARRAGSKMWRRAPVSGSLEPSR